LIKKDTKVSLDSTNLIKKDTKVSLDSTNLIKKDTKVSLDSTNLIKKDTKVSLDSTNLIKKGTKVSVDSTNKNIYNNEDRLIFISTSTINDKAIIKIKDNGGGIPKDIIHKIFEPYFTTKHKSQGTGLGLHITYNLIVDGMGGTIEANNINYSYDNTNYTGAQFTITLPLS